MLSSVSQSTGKYTRPLRASSPTSRQMFVNCMAKPNSHDRAKARSPRSPMSRFIIAPTVDATRAQYVSNWAAVA